jgi:16S rRNA (cytosine967-C5)-methyltransferase
MAGGKPNPARAVAVAALNQFDPKRNYIAPILDKLLDKTSEKQRATDIVFGTIRNRAAIDTVITQFADCPVERIPAELLNIIRIGTYELIYSPTTPDYSIVNEAVENARAIAGKKQTGFANAVLRQISRHIKNRSVPLSRADAGNTLPQTSLTGCEFDTCFLPEPKTSTADYLSTAFSLPGWLVADWLSEFGIDKTKNICFASNRRPSIYIRPNTLKTTTPQLAEKLRQAGINLEISDDESMLRLKSPQAVADLPGFAEGLFSVQDLTASLPVRILQPKPGWTILDLCAAPGIKTTQLAELTADKARIIATDINNQRLEKVKENITRLGITSIKTVSYENIQKAVAEAGDVNAVLLDAPCSNTGVLAKRLEARYRIKPKTIQELMKTQAELLETAATMIRPAGKICYSTCSIQKQENSERIKDFLQKNSDFELESERLILPSADGTADHDGGYAAIIVVK